VRKLIYIPAWHNRIDLGVDEAVRENEGMSIFLRWGMLDKYFRKAEIYWDIVDAALDRLDIDDWARIRVFSDSVYEVSAKVKTGVRELAQEGSRHMQIVMKLLARGAKLEVTEDKKLFVGKSKQELFDTPLDKRDRAIARSINKRLKNGEIGFLILGMSHKTFQQHLNLNVSLQALLTDKDIEKFAERIKELG